ncbi:5-amino-6-(D-ribitylamino)uracil--L-tyrosine 4-hydroxyphenyl transferase CofH [Paraburkholderia antibiotica]|uniref:FO synthase n=1 Tax=Paraburkholderia antibiotica TaxID=2728839 RepID=A0A7X9X7F2_9BURK|nr:5-amino-6-(D-ribitylamino)uracil--L-tyrosine 4-hydroxyphenyl transferase CofH [Paraburkholderia antibiotica]NML32882.1 5-amino-6-(D-ribitylamino)uracil--L-tyrosine 4-hydroxyphenyl transferase CofH [Paraburkholderia antibiotica]
MIQTATPPWTAQTLLDTPLNELLSAAAKMRDQGHAGLMTYSRKVFIPLTQLCRDVCHYCTFAKSPSAGIPAYLSPDEVLKIARAGEAAGCAEALFTLGDKPELRHRAAREALDAMGYATTIDYLIAMCDRVRKETKLLPHVNPGVMTREDIERLRAVSVSQGVMLESTSERLCERGGVHFGSPDKDPAVRLATLKAAGEAQVPFTTGILIGIGETRQERLDSLFAIRELHRQFGHVQEVIVQNFRAKAATKCAGMAEPDLEDLMWTIACARLILGPEMNLQAPPNLSPDEYPRLIEAGINDWGGVSPVTIDHVNPEAPWPALTALRIGTARGGKTLVERTAVYPSYVRDMGRWVDKSIQPTLRHATDADGLARTDTWSPGLADAVTPPLIGLPGTKTTAVREAIKRAEDGAITEADVLTLLRARGPDVGIICAAADELRRRTVGDTVAYVVTRNINYTNVCHHRCTFCAFSKGKGHDDLRGPAYDLSLDEVARRTREAWARGGTEVCMQGGIHPGYTGENYLAFVRAAKEAVPGIHVHAFSPLEVTHGAATLGMSIERFLERLRDAGLGSLPGTAAEILSDDVRAQICPDKLKTAEWLAVIEAAHRVGLKTTSTIMFGHVEYSHHVARHLMLLRELQARTAGITELVPLPFVHMEAPMYRKGLARSGPTYRESILIHAVARLALHPLIPNIQVSWVKLGEEGMRMALQSGANDMGGTLMNESISRAAGTEHGQEYKPRQMEALIASVGRQSRQRNTLYGTPDQNQVRASYDAPELDAMQQTPARKRPNQIILEQV